MRRTKREVMIDKEIGMTNKGMVERQTEKQNGKNWVSFCARE